VLTLRARQGGRRGCVGAVGGSLSFEGLSREVASNSKEGGNIVDWRK
jgi:hypothetical protein